MMGRPARDLADRKRENRAMSSLISATIWIAGVAATVAIARYKGFAWRPMALFGLLFGPAAVLVTACLDPNAGSRQAVKRGLESEPSPGEWTRDPSGRFELRYHDGSRWTNYVSSRGVITIDQFR
jgi:hypothetical protein